MVQSYSCIGRRVTLLPDTSYEPVFCPCRLHNVPLVCRRFRDACRDPNAWPELHALRVQPLSEARCENFLRWLAVRVSKLQTIVIGDVQVRRQQLVRGFRPTGDLMDVRGDLWLTLHFLKRETWVALNCHLCIVCR